MGDHCTLEINASRLPVEVCENVIDMLYSGVFQEQAEHNRALHSCALVCKAWRTRSQRNLFYSVVLYGTGAVCKLAAVLENGPHLCDYVHEVLIVGRTFHTATNPLSLFPVVLHGRLPKLQKFSVQHIADGYKWPYHRTSDSETTKPLEHLPLHPRFPRLLSAFTAVNYLLIYGITFRHFNDFLAMVNALPALRDIGCQNVGCITFGSLPMYTKPRTDVGHPGARPFASNLQGLVLVCRLQCMRY